MIEKKLSFRDPEGFVFKQNNKIFRAVKKNNYKFFLNLINMQWFKDFAKEEKIQNTYFIEYNYNLDATKLSNDYFILEHKEFFLPIFANEMCSSQLYESALLTLDILDQAIDNNIIIKDASAWNIIFENSKPKFIDITSFEKWDGNYIWRAYGQFVRHFIVPLAINKYKNIPISFIFNNYRDGIDIKTGSQILGYSILKSFALIETILLPLLFKNIKKNTFNSNNEEVNKKIFKSTIIRLKKYIKKFKYNKKVSTWGNYKLERDHYSEDDLKIKKNFIKEILKTKNYSNLIDLGCNTCEYSQLASDYCSVFACDSDENALNLGFQETKGKNINIFFQNISNPSPGIGWLNKEYKSFISKTKEKFNLVLCLGLMHHLLIAERIPLNKIFDFLYNLTNKDVIFEYVPKDDEKFKMLASINLNLYDFFTENYFFKELEKKFIIIDDKSFNYSKRRIFLLKKK